MKKLAFFLIVSIALFSCKEDSKTVVDNTQSNDSVTIKGYFERIGNGTKVTMYNFTASNKEVVDSTHVQNRSFAFTIPKKDYVEMYMVSVNGFEEFIPVISSQTNLTIRVNNQSLFLSDVSGDEANDAFSAYKKEKTQYNDQINGMNELMGMNVSADPAMKAEFDKRMQALQATAKAAYFKALNDNKNNFASGLIFEDLMQDNLISLQEAINLFNILPPAYTNSDGGKSTYQYLIQQGR